MGTGKTRLIQYMRLFFGILFSLSALSSLGNSVLVSPTTTYITPTIPAYSLLGPGDTIFLKAGQWGRLTIKGFSGNDKKPLVIMNAAGQVILGSDTDGYALSIQNCRFFKLSGKGDPRYTYGIRLQCPSGVGMGIGYGSTNYEIDHLEITDTKGPGILAKTEPECGGMYNRESFTQYDTRIHDCYIHHTGTEGIYLGNTFYNGYKTACNGKDTLLYPHLLDGVEIANNIVSFTGWDGIQVSSSLNALIHDNQVSGDSQAKQAYQMNGIIIGNGTGGKVYNNVVKNGEGTGIICFYLDELYIYNNLIINPGLTNNDAGSKYGMYIDDRDAQPKAAVNVFHNLIVNPRMEGIRFIGNAGEAKHRLINNAIVHPQADAGLGARAYINLQGNRTDQIKVLNNSLSNKVDSFQFLAPEAFDFRLQASSPLIDKGIPLQEVFLQSDFFRHPRNYGSGSDNGPIEYSNLQGANPKKDEDIGLSCYPNPALDTDLNISFQLKSAEEITLTVEDAQNRVIEVLLHEYRTAGAHRVSSSVSSLQPGIYFIQLRGKSFRKSIKFIR